jgi:uncharacterized protein YfiM (DUF2279 family)
MFGGAIVTGAMTFWARKQESDRQDIMQKHELEMARLDKQAVMVKEARESATMGKSWVRRAIALMIVTGYIFGTKVVPVFWPDVPVAVSYSVIDPKTFFGPERELVEWVVVNGIAITPLDSSMLFAIIGMFFGYEVVRKAHR